jgi:hypothetical protein
MSHHVVRQVIAFHFDYRLQFLLGIVFGFLHMHRNPPACWLLPLLPDLQLVVQTHDRVFGLVFNLLEALVYVWPEVLAKYFLVIKRITDQSLNLLLDCSVEVFKRLRHNFFLLVFK